VEAKFFHAGYLPDTTLTVKFAEAQHEYEKTGHTRKRIETSLQVHFFPLFL
jgi:hypothetical protein